MVHGVENSYILPVDEGINLQLDFFNRIGLIHHYGIMHVFRDGLRDGFSASARAQERQGEDNHDDHRRHTECPVLNPFAHGLACQ